MQIVVQLLYRSQNSTAMQESVSNRENQISAMHPCSTSMSISLILELSLRMVSTICLLRSLRARNRSLNCIRMLTMLPSSRAI